MPFVRVDLPSSFSDERVAAVSDAVHRSLVATFNVPADDRFHALQRRAAGETVCAPAYMGVSHGERVVFIQITCNEGRTVEMKKALFAALAEAVSAVASVPPADVIVHLVEVKKENWSFGNGIAQYAQE